jgi:arabinan endo-1,5-alpha-L-arabinosidase
MDGWPVAGGGRAPSDEAMAAPIVIDGGRTGAGRTAGRPIRPPTGPRVRPLWSDDFRGPHWTRAGLAAAARCKDWSLGRGGLVLATQDADLYVDRNTASVLQAALPDGDYRVELELRWTRRTTAAPPRCRPAWS